MSQGFPSLILIALHVLWQLCAYLQRGYRCAHHRHFRSSDPTGTLLHSNTVPPSPIHVEPILLDSHTYSGMFWLLQIKLTWPLIYLSFKCKPHAASKAGIRWSYVSTRWEGSLTNCSEPSSKLNIAARAHSGYTFCMLWSKDQSFTEWQWVANTHFSWHVLKFDCKYVVFGYK